MRQNLLRTKSYHYAPDKVFVNLHGLFPKPEKSNPSGVEYDEEAIIEILDQVELT